MCIAIYKPAGKSINKENLKQCAIKNGDGCGFAYINTDNQGVRKIKVKKALDFDTFWSQYERALRVAPESPFLIHFRIKTHGPIAIETCHPFVVDREHVFIHNGIIKNMGAAAGKSDTMLFNEKFLQSLSPGWMQDDGIKRLIEHIIDYSKLVVLNIDGDIQIYNETSGHWKEDIWYSNYSYVIPSTNYSYNNNKGTNKDYTGMYYDTVTRSWKPRADKVEEKKTSGKVIPFEDKCWSTSYKPCDLCGSHRTVSTMKSFCKIDDFLLVCSLCASKLYQASDINSSDEVTIGMYCEQYNAGVPSVDMITSQYMKSTDVIQWWGITEDLDTLMDSMFGVSTTSREEQEMQDIQDYYDSFTEGEDDWAWRQGQVN